MIFELRVQRYDFFLIYAREVGVRKLGKGAFFFLCSSVVVPCFLSVEYSWDIRRVFMGYSYVSVMYRLCVGYVSVNYRSILGASGFFDNIRPRIAWMNTDFFRNKN